MMVSEVLLSRWGSASCWARVVCWVVVSSSSSGRGTVALNRCGVVIIVEVALIVVWTAGRIVRCMKLELPLLRLWDRRAAARAATRDDELIIALMVILFGDCVAVARSRGAPFATARSCNKEK